MRIRVRHLPALLATFALALVAGAQVAGNALAAVGEACPNEQLRKESEINQQTGLQRSTELPDCRAYELVTPPEKGQANIQPTGGGAVGQRPLVQAAADGEGVMYDTVDALPGAQSSSLIEQALAYRGPAEWADISLTGPQLVAEREGSWIDVFAHFSPNLTCATDETEEPMETLPSGEPTPLPAGESGGEVINLYLWQRASGRYTLVTNVDPLNRLSFAGVVAVPYHVYGATEDCSRIVFATEYRLLAQAPASGDGLYEWDEGALRLVSVLPDETGAAVTKYGAGLQEGSLEGAVSRDGSRIFFTSQGDSGADAGRTEVFLREAGHTTEVSASKTTTADLGAEFQVASGDGSQALFIANYGLTPSSSTGASSCAAGGGSGCDLYDFDAETGTLTDLSADANVGDAEGAGVLGVLGISEDGSYVYFCALGQLVPGKGRTEAEDKARKEGNLFLWHAGTIRYVATIDQGDYTNVGNDLLSHGEQLGSRVTPSGQALLFTSNDKITGYDNESVGGLAESELYLYSAPSEELACVSCDPDGERPVGSATTTPVQLNNGYAPRNLSSSGDQVFFTSEDPLVAGATAGKNGYEWERAGTGSCTEAEAQQASEPSGGCIYLIAPGGTVLDASAGGEDVFVTTRFPMVAQDQDGTEDVYDLRVDGGYPAPVHSSCSGEECQGEAPGSPAYTLPGSMSPPIVGNLARQVGGGGATGKAGSGATKRKQRQARRLRLRRALQACTRLPQRRRATCRRRARSRYGGARGRGTRTGKGKGSIAGDRRSGTKGTARQGGK